MIANKVLISDIFNRWKLLEIPFYQRSYVWKEDQWERFMSDLEYLSKWRTPYFMGALILKDIPVPMGNSAYIKHYMVIDGQQRLTTLIIFMKALCLLKGDRNSFEMFRLNNGKIALKHDKFDSDAFGIVVSCDTPEEIKSNPDKSKIIEAFNFFIRKIEKDRYDLNVIRMGMQFVGIELEPNEDEQQVFDTINSLGVKLTTAELLKNYLFTNNSGEYDKKWVPAFEKDSKTKQYWDMEITTGRGKRLMVDVFLDAYFRILVNSEKYNVPPNDRLRDMRTDQLSYAYKDFTGRFLGGNKSAVIDGITEYAEIFKQGFDPRFLEEATPPDYGIRRMNVIVFGLKHTTLVPYLLFLLNKVDRENHEEFSEMCRVLESYIMRRMLAEMSTKNYDSLFAALIRDGVVTAEALKKRLKSSRTLEDSIPSDDDMREDFQSAWLFNTQTKGILYLIESRITPKMASTALMGFNDYSLEHLMPKNWRKNWQPPYLTDEEANARDRKLLTLGNLAIISQNLNSAIRDGSWQTKKSGKGYKNGLKDCAGGLATMQDVLDKEEWNEEDIEKRAKWLYEIAAEMWKI